MMIPSLGGHATGEEQSERSYFSSSHTINQRHTIDSLKIPPETRAHLQKLLRKARKQSLSQAIIFTGPDQTRKLGAARAVSRELQRPLLKFDVKRITSRYIGETEKNIDGIFRKAKTQGAVLFFDEADALFGKRTSVTDSHDRYANQEVSYLLQRIRRYPGLMIFSTRDISSSRMSRITKNQSIITFPC